MKIRHQTIPNKLIHYLEGDLPEGEHEQIRRHLASCPRCSRDVERLEKLWKTDKTIPRITPPPFLWTRLMERLEAEKQTSLPERITGVILPYFRPVIVTFSLLVTIFLGIQFGELILTPPGQGAVSAPQTTTLEEELGMDYFSVIPPGSLGETAVLITAAEQENSK